MTARRAMTGSRSRESSVRSDDPVVIVGGGIAGISAALRLSEAGVPVLLLETRRKLGGRATSFSDVRTGHTIDNCQHVAMGCCTNYLDLLDRLGAADDVEWHDRIHWYEPGGRTSVMAPGPLPAPAHYSQSFLGQKFLSLRDKAAIARAMLAMLRCDRAQLTDQTFGVWLAAHRQPESAVRAFWTPVVVSACNLSVDRVAASSAIHVFQEGFLAHRGASRLGVPRVPLIRLYDRAEPAIAAVGGEMRLGTGVERIDYDRVLTTSGETVRARCVICAVAPERAVKLVAPDLCTVDPRFDAIQRIEYSPILGVHLAFDRPIMHTPNAVLVDRPTQWLFRKSDSGDMIHAVISAADDWIPLSEDEITRRVLEDIRLCLPGSRDAVVRSSRPVKEKRATFAPTPATEAARPGTNGPSGIILAGDYVRTGWPATMEGATRSGYLAAAAVLGEDPQRLLLPSLRVAPLARLLGGPSMRMERTKTPTADAAGVCESV